MGIVAEADLVVTVGDTEAVSNRSFLNLERGMFRFAKRPFFFSSRGGARRSELDAWP